MPDMLPPLAGVSLSEALAEAYTVAPVDRVILLCIEVWSPDFDEPAYIVADKQGHDARLESTAPRNASTYVTHVPVAIDATWPSETDDDTPVGRLIIDGVSPVLAEQLDRARGSLNPVTTIWRQYVSTDLSAPHRLPVLVLELSVVDVTDLRVTATASRPGRGSGRFPAVAYTRLTHPGLAA